MAILEKRLSAFERGEQFPTLFLATKIAILLEIPLKPFLNRWAREKERGLGQKRGKIRITNFGCLILSRMVELGFSSLKEFGRVHQYHPTLLRAWIFGRALPLPATLEKVSRDLELKLKDLKRVVAEDRKRLGRTWSPLLAARKIPTYPTVIAFLVHQMRKVEGLSFPDLEKLGFPRSAIHQLESGSHSSYGLLLPSKRLFRLSLLLGIPPQVTLGAYLLDRIVKNSEFFNLAKQSFEMARVFTWHRLMREKTIPQLARESGVTRTKLKKLLAGERLLTEEELNQLITFFELGPLEQELFRAAWERDRAKIEEEEQKVREETYWKLVEGIPQNLLSDREWEFLQLFIREGVPVAEIARRESCSKQWIHYLIKRAKGKIARWRTKNAH